MNIIEINTKQLKECAKTLKCGDRVLLSGTVYTARDAAHARIFKCIDNNTPLPFDLDGATIYYAGPTPTPKNMVIGSCGPTTSKRMDCYSPKLLDMGLTCMIGKGERNEEVINAIIRNSAVYLCAIGGAGALAAKHITKCEVIAFDDLGCESVKKLEFDRFPLTVAIDCSGNNIFNK
ncbi:MAG: FumA C-terminus/TtdB family hydratase beta subunit [Acutalibacteraceae bacterium]|nr:FumA C-terminus/TtdB family hydratase beta subunit [Acutalibacteraceae bacterium]